MKLNIRKNIFSKTKYALENRAILYFVFLLSIAEVLYLIGTNNLVLLSLFIASAVAISFYNKNMIVILFISIILVNLVKYGSELYSVRENYDTTTVPSTPTDTSTTADVVSPEGSGAVTISGTDNSKQVSDTLQRSLDLKNQLQSLIAKTNADNAKVAGQIEQLKQDDQNLEKLSDSLQAYQELKTEQMNLLTQVNAQNATLKDSVSNAQLKLSATPTAS